jgi:hypothetical protein
MKKKLLLALIGIVLIIGLVAGCGGFGDSPSAVVKNAYAAAEKGNAKAVALLLLSGVATSDWMASRIKSKGVIVKTEELIYGDGTAKVTITHKNGDVTNVFLKKIDGAWKISGFEELQQLREWDGKL